MNKYIIRSAIVRFIIAIALVLLCYNFIVPVPMKLVFSAFFINKLIYGLIVKIDIYKFRKEIDLQNLTAEEKLEKYNQELCILHEHNFFFRCIQWFVTILFTAFLLFFFLSPYTPIMIVDIISIIFLVLSFFAYPLYWQRK